MLDGINVVDASDYMDVAVFKNALRRVPLPLLADFIRLKAMAASHAPLKWFLDGDVLWVADVRERIQCPQGAYDHLFSSMDAPRSRWCTAEIYEKHWALYYLKTPRDKLYISSPFQLPRESPLLEPLLSHRSALIEAGTAAYNSFMECVRDTVRHWGLEAAILPPFSFSPIPYWTGRRCLEERDGKDPNISSQRIIAHSVGVNCFWQSARALYKGKEDRSSHPAGDEVAAHGSLHRVHPGSVWHSLLLHVDSVTASKSTRPHGVNCEG